MPKEIEPGDHLPARSVQPDALPPALQACLASQKYGRVTETTNFGTAYVLKAPRADIESARGHVPVQVSRHLYFEPTVPVIRTVLSLHDRPKSALSFESFINIADPAQRAEFAALASQERLLLLFHDEELKLRLTKLVPQNRRQRLSVAYLLREAHNFLTTISDDRLDFEKAKAAVMAVTDI